ncbi:MAG: hypothetical protein JWP97_2171 [Labilithrix sp.]|nr:hypothetical protein [Labilithrix sp.]
MLSDDTSPFTYVESCWSVGDRYEVSLDFPDEATLRRELRPIGLDEIADTKLGDLVVRSVEPPIGAEVFGPAVSLCIGPEDPHEFLGDEHRAQAKRLAAVLRAQGTARYLRVPAEEKPAHGSIARFASPAHRLVAARSARPALDTRTCFTVVLTERVAAGFRTHGLRPLPRLGDVPMRSPDVTDEARIRDGATSAPYLLDALSTGLVARATITTGRRLDGELGPVVAELIVFRADEERLAAAARCRAVLAALDVPLPADDATLAAQHRQATIEEGVTTSLAQELVAHALVARSALSRATLEAPMAIVGGALAALQTERLPCLFDARRAVREATDLDVLFGFVRGEIDRALALREDRRRCTAVWLRGDTMATYAILSAVEAARLLDSGVVALP